MSSVQSYRNNLKHYLEVKESEKNKRINNLNKQKDKNLGDLSNTKILKIGKIFIYVFHLKKNIKNFHNDSKIKEFIEEVEDLSTKQWIELIDYEFYSVFDSKLF